MVHAPAPIEPVEPVEPVDPVEPEPEPEPEQPVLPATAITLGQAIRFGNSPHIDVPLYAAPEHIFTTIVERVAVAKAEYADFDAG